MVYYPDKTQHLNTGQSVIYFSTTLLINFCFIWEK